MTSTRGRATGALAAAVVGVGLAVAAGTGAAAAAAHRVDLLDPAGAGAYHVAHVDPGHYLNVRRLPGTDSDVVARYLAGSSGVFATGQRAAVDGREWRQLSLEHGTGWVDAAYLAADAPAPARGGSAFVVVGAGAHGLNVRVAPSLRAAVARRLPTGTTGTTTGLTRRADGLAWAQVRLDAAHTGWVAASYLHTR